MAEGRMLKKKISKSRKLAALPSDSDRLFYTWLIPHLDVEGRIHADPDILKGDIVPRLKNWSPEKVEKTLLNLAENELIILYTANGDRYLELLRFADEQWLRKDKEKASEIPAPSDSELISRPKPAQSPPKARLSPDEDKIREDKIREEKIREDPPKKPGDFFSKSQLNEVERYCKTLASHFKKNFWSWVQACINDSYRADAIIFALGQLWEYRKSTKDPWPYLNHVVLVEHQNRNEAEHIAEHEKLKQEELSNEIPEFFK